MQRMFFRANEFEGPLDLLLHLISKHKLDILDIEISELLRQYLVYMEQWAETDLEIQSEFLEMAARLVHIKTVMLLPRHEEEAAVLKAGLTGELMEYRLCRRSAEIFAVMAALHAVSVRPQAAISVDMTYTLVHPVDVLCEAAALPSSRAVRRLPVRETAFSGIVKRRVVSVSGRILHLLRRLMQQHTLPLNRVFQPGDRSELVATFLALLELIKGGRVKFSASGDAITLQKTSRKNRAGRGV